MEYEVLIRLGSFLVLFAIFALAETLAPRRARVQPRAGRWFTNLTLVVIDSLTLRLMSLLLPLLAVGAAIDAAREGWGLFNAFNLPVSLEVLAAFLILDFAIWAQHLLFHKIPALWRLHRVHHADRDFDVSTALRFHPIEIAASMLIKIGLVYLIGAPAIAVILFEVVLNGSAMFNHANWRLPLAVDRVLRLVLVTPDMHRVHHSVHRHETDSNYGFCLSIWDRWFGTYTAQPQDGHDDMVIGLEWQDERPMKLGWSLMLPFRRK
jgi:sterol desaturase/sphingolipid hydroxylase (fatty acid hydroxylase superfamily)